MDSHLCVGHHIRRGADESRVDQVPVDAHHHDRRIDQLSNLENELSGRYHLQQQQSLGAGRGEYHQEIVLKKNKL